MINHSDKTPNWLPIAVYAENPYGYMWKYCPAFATDAESGGSVEAPMTQPVVQLGNTGDFQHGLGQQHS